MSLENNVLNLIEKPIKDMGYTKVYVNYLRESGTNYLRVTIDKNDVISLEDIVKVNDVISPILDKADLIQSNYVLDVTSLGAEKPIEINELDQYKGKYVHIHLSHPYKGENILEGDLESVSNDTIVLAYKEKTRLIKAEISRKDIDKARLAIKF